MKIYISFLIFATTILTQTSAADSQNFYIGEIIWTGANYCPRNTIQAHGQSISIESNSDAYRLMSNYYGGDARHTFNVPDLQVAAPVGVGRAKNGNAVDQGQRFGGVGCPEGQNCSTEYQSFLGLTACVVIPRPLPRILPHP